MWRGIVMQNIIDEFLDILYDKKSDKKKTELECYVEMREKASDIIIKELERIGCKALVTSRIKEKESLRRKLYKRDIAENNMKYKTYDDIRKDIFDFLGVRISLYFPNDMEIVEEIIKKNFELVEDPIIHPQKNKQHLRSKKNGYTKVFSGYKARHYRVSLQSDIMQIINAESINLKSVFEIQVISLVLHAWAEVEHDIVYKSDYKDLPHEVHVVLDEINGLMELGELSFVRLKNEIVKHISVNGIFSDHYELSVYIRDNVPKEVLESHGIGNMKYLFNLLKKLDKEGKNKIDEMIEKIEFGSMQYLAGEFVTYLMIESPKYYEKAYIEKSNIQFQKEDDKETYDKRLKEYRVLIKRYAYFLHMIYRRGKEKGIFDEIKSSENDGEELIDLLVSKVLGIDKGEFTLFRADVYNFSTEAQYQSDTRLKELMSKVKRYQRILDSKN